MKVDSAVRSLTDGIDGSFYLSIDLDFFFSFDIDYLRKRSEMIEQVVATVIDHPNLVLVVDHEELIPHINTNECDWLLNVDTHNDLIDETAWNSKRYRDKLHCGNWVNFVSWKKSGKYLWLYPSRTVCIDACVGLCHYVESDPIDNQALTSWHFYQRNLLLHSVSMLGRQPKAVGICISPDYCDPDKLRKFALQLQSWKSPNAQRLSQMILKELE